MAIPRGGGTLASVLGPWNLASFEGNHTITIPSTNPISGTTYWRVLDPSMPNGNRLDLVPAPAGAQSSQTPSVDSFQTTGGYVIMIGLAQMMTGPNAGNLMYRAELAYYTSYDRSGNGGQGTLLGIQPVPNPPNPDLGGNQTGNIPIQTTSRFSTCTR